LLQGFDVSKITGDSVKGFFCFAALNEIKLALKTRKMLAVVSVQEENVK
jgi:hypothetical protein